MKYSANFSAIFPSYALDFHGKKSNTEPLKRKDFRFFST